MSSMSASEGVFVAVAIGYGFEEERGRSIEIPITPPETPGEITLSRIPIEALITGFRLEPRLGPAVFPRSAATAWFWEQALSASEGPGRNYLPL